jgi:hypothetical protein
MNLVQLHHPRIGRRVAIVEEPQLVFLDGVASVYELAKCAIGQNKSVADLAEAKRSKEATDYDTVYSGQSDWKLLPAFDHPTDPMHCLVTGTGLTHKASAESRAKMHQAQAAGQLTESMRMYQWGVDGGRPAGGTIGVQPEWFYKGTGLVLRAHGQPLQQPAYADDAGEEPEVAAAYVIDDRGTPWRIGFMAGNEFADHVMEKKNYLYLAHSKLRQCAVGPELCLDETFKGLTGTVSIRRGGHVFWSHPIQSGETHMAHSLANLEYHHFKYAEHRQPGQAHIHFFGAAAFSFGAQVELHGGDVMEVAWEGLGRPLQNELHDDQTHEVFVEVASCAAL